MVRERKATEYFTEREGDRSENQWKMPELMAAEGDLRISFRIVRVCTIEQTTLMEARNMRERPRTPSAATVRRGVAERNHLRMALSDREIQVSDLAAALGRER